MQKGTNRVLQVYETLKFHKGLIEGAINIITK